MNAKIEIFDNHVFEIFGNYVLLEKLACGGMAEVFLARPAVREGDGRLLVVKRILPHIASHSQFINMFQREIQILMGFSHPHVVQLHDFGSVQGQPYIAMEYIEGKSLRDVTERLRELQVKAPMSMALSLIAQAAAGLHYAHTFEHKTNGKPLNTIHRDISPHNLLVSFDGNLKVIDFGVAKAGCDVLDLSRTGTLKGKVGYFSPEQLEGHALDSRTDIFSLGVVAWELLTGERLFAKPGDSEVNVMVKLSQCEKHVVAPSKLNPAIPPDVDRTILKALTKDPNQRFREAREFQSELRKHLMKYYPDYTYADTGEWIRKLFSEDMIDQRRRTQDLNQNAQEMLAGSADENTKVIGVASNGGGNGAGGNGAGGNGTGGASAGGTQPTPEKANTRTTISEEVVALRLTEIEAALKQKASARHYMMLAFYVISILALKWTDLHNLWLDYSARKATVEVASHSPRTTATIPGTTPVKQDGNGNDKRQTSVESTSD